MQKLSLHGLNRNHPGRFRAAGAPWLVGGKLLFTADRTRPDKSCTAQPGRGKPPGVAAATQAIAFACIAKPASTPRAALSAAVWLCEPIPEVAGRSCLVVLIVVHAGTNKLLCYYYKLGSCKLSGTQKESLSWPVLE